MNFSELENNITVQYFLSFIAVILVYIALRKQKIPQKLRI